MPRYYVCKLNALTRKIIGHKTGEVSQSPERDTYIFMSIERGTWCYTSSSHKDEPQAEMVPFALALATLRY